MRGFLNEKHCGFYLVDQKLIPFFFRKEPQINPLSFADNLRKSADNSARKGQMSFGHLR